ncbi:unnamed protein product [Blepharisma stoltei]|uniref:Uncharacterized protein n=1 Tax=Blepharisma stoltei TaxID=1481888 RepID=A0AAU9JSP0_9CILI|nr:unnamed protein product [Blepharisma stoltei]
MKLTQMPKADYHCQSVIFNGDILISGYEIRHLLRYSIDIDSFSIIPYHFEKRTKKILINAENLYVIECKYQWFIYESKAKDVYGLWGVVANWVINIWPSQVYCTYNKGAIYIITDEKQRYCKFDLRKMKISSF